MNIGRLDDAQMRLVGLGQDREGVHGDHGADAGRAREEAAPRNIREEVHLIVSNEVPLCRGRAPGCRFSTGSWRFPVHGEQTAHARFK